MSDDKRFLRRLKRQIKQTGNRKMRRHLQDVYADAEEFDYGRDLLAGERESLEEVVEAENSETAPHLRSVGSD